jgi:hypothetical protein
MMYKYVTVLCKNLEARAIGIEPTAYGFGDRHSTN